MKRFLLATSALLVVMAFVSPPVHGQENDGEPKPLVLVGEVTASISDSGVDFARLPSRKVLLSSPSGIEMIDFDQFPEIHPAVPRMGVRSIGLLPESERYALARRFQTIYDPLISASENQTVARSDVSAIVKFMLSVDLPYDEVFLARVREQFGFRDH